MPAAAVPHYRSFAYYRLIKQDSTVVQDLANKVHHSTLTGDHSDQMMDFDGHRKMRSSSKMSFDELTSRMRSKRGNRVF